MGGKVPRRLVSAGDALPHRAHEEDRPVTARASRTDPQLFPRSEAALQRGCRGPEQQSQTHNEKILRIPHLPLSRTRPLSLTWQTTGAGINPRFFLTNHNLNIGLLFVLDVSQERSEETGDLGRDGIEIHSVSHNRDCTKSR